MPSHPKSKWMFFSIALPLFYMLHAVQANSPWTSLRFETILANGALNLYYLPCKDPRSNCPKLSLRYLIKLKICQFLQSWVYNNRIKNLLFSAKIFKYAILIQILCLILINYSLFWKSPLSVCYSMLAYKPCCYWM